jgi:hypothetical protein
MVAALEGDDLAAPRVTGALRNRASVVPRGDLGKSLLCLAGTTRGPAQVRRRAGALLVPAKIVGTAIPLQC